MLVHDHVFEVIGVAAPEFTGLEKVGVDLWTLIDVWNERPGLPRGPLMGLAGRLRPGVNVERARAALTFSTWAPASIQSRMA
ncbi:MAG: hypothetical protein ACRD44_05295 [Bryobacteraceae bacterium]